jgi:hypothetical protein
MFDGGCCEPTIVWAPGRVPAGTASALYGVSRRAMRWGSGVENSPTWVVIDRKGILTLIHAPRFSTPTGHVQDVDLVLEELRKGSKQDQEKSAAEAQSHREESSALRLSASAVGFS